MFIRLINFCVFAFVNCYKDLMENYKKGKNVEEPLERDKIPISNLPDNFLWMQVRGGSKIRNLVTHALNQFPDVKDVVWTGSGVSVGKAVTCAEIMKRECNNSLHQITKLCYRTVEEYWDPLLADLDQIVVKRRLPMIHIYLSANPLDPNESGFQAPGASFVYEPIEKSGKSNYGNQNYNNRNRQNKNQANKNQRQSKQSNLQETAKAGKVENR